MLFIAKKKYTIIMVNTNDVVLLQIWVLKSCSKWCDFQILYSGASTAFPAEIRTVYYLNSSKKQLTLQAICSLLQRRIT